MHGGRGTDDFHRHIRAVTAGGFANGGDDISVVWVDAQLGAELLGERQFFISQIHGDDFPAARRLECLHDEQADHARADDHRAVAQCDGRAIHRVHRHGHRLDHRRVFEGEVVWHRINNVLRHDGVFGEAAVLSIIATRHAQHASILAQIHLAAPAKFAAAAGHHRVECHAVTFAHRRHCAAGARHHAAGLVSHDERRNASAA